MRSLHNFIGENYCKLACILISKDTDIKNMKVSHATAVWERDLIKGKGFIRSGSGVFQGNYSFASRFEEGKDTNPEELIGAAHAACFSMALANDLAQAGYPPKRIETKAEVTLDKVEDNFRITTITLNTNAEVSGIDEKKFLEYADNAKKNCPVSYALRNVDIKLTAKLTN
jgi:osmotically inducible protein OsmC